MNHIDKRSKREQLFILLMLFSVILIAVCLTGCGGKSCETPKCGQEDLNPGTAAGCSIPGCGGCLTSGRGCDCACWPQSIKLINASSDSGIGEEKDSISITACDTRYYGNGCLGCGQREKSCYTGCLSYEEGDGKISGVFYGSTDSEEKIIGCIDGCGGCVATGKTGKYVMNVVESLTEVD